MVRDIAYPYSKSLPRLTHTPQPSPATGLACPTLLVRVQVEGGYRSPSVKPRFEAQMPLFATSNRSLLIEDQIYLLKGAAVEICHIILNTTFCLQTQNFFCGPLRYTMEDGAHCEQPEAGVCAVWDVGRGPRGS